MPVALREPDVCNATSRFEIGGQRCKSDFPLTPLQQLRCDEVLTYVEAQIGPRPSLFNPGHFKLPIQFREEIQKNHVAMCAFGERFDAHERRLIETCAWLAAASHANHLRRGSRPSHYTSHLRSVAELVDARWPGSGEIFGAFTPSELSSFNSHAIAIAAALLHDAIEDFSISFQYSPHRDLPQPLWMEVAARFIHRQISLACGEAIAEFLLQQILALSIRNTDEFPSSEYLAEIARSPFSTLIKYNDIEHNFMTAPSYCPAYTIVYGGAQYAPWISDPSYRERLDRLVLANIGAFHIDQRTSWRSGISDSPCDYRYYCDLVRKYEGGLGIARMLRYYADLKNQLEHSAETSETDCNPQVQHLVTVLTSLLQETV